jgi:hypothetical protein
MFSGRQAFFGYPVIALSIYYSQFQLLTLVKIRPKLASRLQDSFELSGPKQAFFGCKPFTAQIVGLLSSYRFISACLSVKYFK